MNTAVKTQGKKGTEHQEIWKVKEEWAMKTAMGIKKVNMRLHQAIATKAPVRFLGGLALGALLMTATAVPLSPAHADEPARPLSIEQIECYPEISNDCPALIYHEATQGQVLGPFSSEEIVDVPGLLQTEVWLLCDVYPVSTSVGAASRAGTEDLPGLLQTEVWLPGDIYPVSTFEIPVRTPLTGEQIYRSEGFEEFGIPWQIDDDGMVVEAVQKPVASRPLSNMEIERLDYQIDGMLSAAAQTPSVGRPLSNMEMERMDYQIDSMLSAAAQNPSAGRPLSDEQLRLILDYEMTGLPNPNFTYDELMQAKVGSEPALEQ